MIQTKNLKNELSSSQGARLKHTLEQISNLASKSFGIDLIPYGQESLQKFEELDGCKKHLIETHLQQCLLVYTEVSSIATLEVSASTQIRCLNSALWKYGLFAKGDWEHLIEATDVIEVYDFEHTQIFRNLEFFRICSYDLLHIMTNEWWELWDRSEKSIKDLAQSVEAVYKAKAPIHLDVEPFFTREKGAAKRAFMTHFKYFIPLWKKSSEMPEAFISLASGPELEASNVEPLLFQ